KFCQAQFGVAPEGLNAVDMTTVSGKFIVVMVDAMVLIAFHHQSVVGAPAVGVDRALAGKHLTAEITSINSAFEQFMTGEQKTFPLLLSRPMTATFRPDPRPRPPRTLRGPKELSSPSTLPVKGAASPSAISTTRARSNP